MYYVYIYIYYVYDVYFPQSARDIESKMRNETRLKLFTLDADTQVKESR